MKTSVSSIHCERPLVTERVAIGDFYSLYGTLESSDNEK